MRIDVVTLFPEFFPGPLATGLLGRTLGAGRARVDTIDPRAFTLDRHRSVDDTPYGGGPGMVMRPEPVLAALAEARRRGPGPVLMMSPQGEPLTQRRAEAWAGGEHLVLLCGRYEGFDERIRDAVDHEVSIGDFVLTGGEYAALSVIDAVCRLLPGTVGNHASTVGDSFGPSGLLEHPQYTRPERLAGVAVPEVLRGGDHGAIARWRRDTALQRTRQRRPELLTRVPLGPADLRALRAVPSRGGALQLVVEADPAAVHGLLELSAAYALGGLVLVAPSLASVEALTAAVQDWRARIPTPPRARRGERRRIREAREDAEARSQALQTAAARCAVVADAEAALSRLPVERLDLRPADPIAEPIPGETEAADPSLPGGVVAEPAAVPPWDARTPAALWLGFAPTSLPAALAASARRLPAPRPGQALDRWPRLGLAAVLLERLVGEG